MFNSSQSPLVGAFLLRFAEVPSPAKVLAREGAGKQGGGPLGPLPLPDQFDIERSLRIFIKKILHY